jgi:hypothetical protein
VYLIRTYISRYGISGIRAPSKATAKISVLSWKSLLSAVIYRHLAEPVCRRVLGGNPSKKGDMVSNLDASVYIELNAFAYPDIYVINWICAFLLLRRARPQCRRPRLWAAAAQRVRLAQSYVDPRLRVRETAATLPGTAIPVRSAAGDEHTDNSTAFSGLFETNACPIILSR